MTLQRTLILASSSPRRQELIHLLQLPVQIQTSHVDETPDPGMSPSEIAESLSMRKALAVYDQLNQQGKKEQGIIIGSDTIVVYNHKVLGKPADERDSLGMLQELQGKTHLVISGVACVDCATGKIRVSHEVTKVTMKPLSDGQIKRYIATGEPKDKAGSYGIQGLGSVLIERIEGDYYNVVGLPLSLLSDMLLEFGIEVI